MRRFAAVAALMLASCNAAGPAPEISIQDPWARATAAGQSGTAAYFTISNAGGTDRLLSVSTPAADASLHSTTMSDGVMRMRPVDGVEVPANGSVEFKPGGMHVMLMGLKQPLESGTTLPLDLKFEKAGDRRVEATVRLSSGEAM